MHSNIRPLKFMFVITDRSLGKKVVKLLNSNGSKHQVAMLGWGTAPTELSAYSGLCDPEKAIITLSVYEDKVKPLFKVLEDELQIGKGAGIAFTVPINSVGSVDMIKYVMHSILMCGGEHGTK